jgi:hypothetical protein
MDDAIPRFFSRQRAIAVAVLVSRVFFYDVFFFSPPGYLARIYYISREIRSVESFRAHDTKEAERQHYDSCNPPLPFRSSSLHSSVALH